jgi:hypothetical protein
MHENCWEIKQCGREADGKNAHLGICSAYLATPYDKLNHGKNGGRMCWYVTGTVCNDELQGNYTQKRMLCLSCEVYKRIKTEEKHKFLLTF